VDLGTCNGVEELLDHAEDAGKTPGRVDDVHLAQTLGVVVLTDLRYGAQVAVHGGGLANTNTLQIHDCAGSLEEVARLAGAGRKTGVGHLFVFADKVLDHALLGRDLSECGEVDVAKLLDVERAAILVLRQRFSSSDLGRALGPRDTTYLVRLVVVLGVELEDLGSLFVVKGADKLLNADASVLGPPLLAVDEPSDCQHTLFQPLQCIVLVLRVRTSVWQARH
jgi:hypothetical protein